VPENFPPTVSRTYNRQRYADYTGYQPVNTAYELRDPSRWQPLVETKGNCVFQVQQFVTPQVGLLQPHSYPRSKLPSLQVPPPTMSNPRLNPAGYKAQVDNVLAVSAGLGPSLDVGRPLGHKVGDMAYEFVKAHIDGKV
jgi:hypothetical protein